MRVPDMRDGPPAGGLPVSAPRVTGLLEFATVVEPLRQILGKGFSLRFLVPTSPFFASLTVRA